MKKISSLCLVFLLFLVFSLKVSATNTSITGGCNTVDGTIPFLGTKRIVDNAVSAILYEVTTDTLMYADNVDEPLPPVSFSKILTALIAIEKGNLSDLVTVRKDVLDSVSKSAAMVGLVADEVLTLEDLLNCMMVGSGNDAAAVIADHVMGSQRAFVEEMNRYAAELGCTGTYFTNVHGLSDPNQYTTARDMTRILTLAIQNEFFCKIFGSINYNVPDTNKSLNRYLEYDNFLMNNKKVVIHYDERVTGSRTGIANDWTRSIASVAESNGLQLICIIMGAKSVYEEDDITVKVFGGYNETRKLLDLGFDGNKAVQVLYPYQVLKQSSVLNGDCDVSIGTHESVFSVVPASTDAHGLSYRYSDEIELTAPIEKGQKVSSVQVWCGGVCIAQTDLYALNSVSALKPDSGSDILPGKNDMTWIFYGLGIIIGVVLIGFVVLCALRIIRIRKIKRLHRRYRRRSR